MIEELAPKIAPVVLANITTRYPYHDSHLTQAGEPPHDPIAAHPAFGNSYDWHSSVHSHWTAIGLLRHVSNPTELREAVVDNLQADRLAVECEYLNERASYERPYGWAWAMMLAAAAQKSSDPAINECAVPLRELTETIAALALKWLSIIPMPVRHGVHSNTAFALGLMHDASLSLEMEDFRNTLAARAREWFATDRDWPANYERSGNDFLSPGLVEADLMRRVLPENEFATWWQEFLPSPPSDSPILTVARIPEVDDGHIVHLHGLNLSRAAALARIAKALQQPALLERARALYDASVERAASGFYTETHWLPTFAWDAASAIDDAQPSLRE